MAPKLRAFIDAAKAKAETSRCVAPDATVSEVRLAIEALIHVLHAFFRGWRGDPPDIT